VQADGIYTQKPSVKIGVQSADCLPILLVNEKKTTVMALHAGWKGLTAGILNKGIQQMKNLSPKQAIFASIGPAIAHCHYEVGPELVEALQNPELGMSEEQLASCLTHGQGDRWFLDLSTASVFILLNSGVSARGISVYRSCTYCSDSWNSARRDKSASLRNWSWIELSPV
jgi:YfiH family protein